MLPRKESVVVQGVHASGLWMTTRMGKGWARYCGDGRFYTEPSLVSKFSSQKTSMVKQDMSWRLRASLGWGTLRGTGLHHTEGCGVHGRMCPALAMGPDKGAGTVGSS